VRSVRAPVVANRELAPGLFSLWAEHARTARDARPGQFLNVKVSDGPDPVLRRPISVADVEKDRLRLVFRAVGRGTGLLGRLKPGDEVDVLGPLGRPVRVPVKRNAIVCGGGVGIAPLLLLARYLRRANRVTVLLGARSREELILDREFRRLGTNLEFATDDGSFGHRGPVTELLGPALEKSDNPIVYACGPRPMLRELVARAGDVPVWGFVEERMGCGTGICYCCAVKRRTGGYVRFCQEGPVVKLNDIEL